MFRVLNNPQRVDNRKKKNKSILLNTLPDFNSAMIGIVAFFPESFHKVL